ncbi:hypothetical protein J6590_003232 [Homalodisca vitripennis]|nr:hypothetical protein J6590_003232 [Homalodisca vitripennis]
MYVRSRPPITCMTQQDKEITSICYSDIWIPGCMVHVSNQQYLIANNKFNSFTTLKRSVSESQFICSLAYIIEKSHAVFTSIPRDILLCIRQLTLKQQSPYHRIKLYYHTYHGFCGPFWMI